MWHMIQEIFGYFLIGSIGMLALAILYLPVYFLLRKRVPLLRQASYLLFTGCILIILDATVLDVVILKIMDGNGILADKHSYNIIPFYSFVETWSMGEQKKVTQMIANILMFVPLGFICPVAFPQTRRLWKIALYMALFSFLIEFIQYFIGRSADIDDFMLNTLGGMIGFAVFYVFSKLRRHKMA